MLEEEKMIKKFKGLNASYIDLGVSYKRHAVLNVKRENLNKYMVGMFILIWKIYNNQELIIYYEDNVVFKANLLLMQRLGKSKSLLESVWGLFSIPGRIKNNFDSKLNSKSNYSTITFFKGKKVKELIVPDSTFEYDYVLGNKKQAELFEKYVKDSFSHPFFWDYKEIDNNIMEVYGFVLTRRSNDVDFTLIGQKRKVLKIDEEHNMCEVGLKFKIKKEDFWKIINKDSVYVKKYEGRENMMNVIQGYAKGDKLYFYDLSGSKLLKFGNDYEFSNYEAYTNYKIVKIINRWYDDRD
jgi:hypothetical protein